MLTDKKIPGKLEKIEQRYEQLRFEKIADVPVEMCETREHYRCEPRKGKWRPVAPGTKWGDDWLTFWFRGDVRLPKAGDGKTVYVRFKSDAETLFMVDGEHRGVFDGNHPVVMMAKKGAAGKRYHLAFEAYTGHTFPGTQPGGPAHVVGKLSRSFGGVEVLLEREDVTAFVFDLRVLRQLAGALPPNSLRRNKIHHALAQVYVAVDAIPDETSEESWRPALARARRVMRPLLAARNGDTAPFMGLIGHSHIDTAWLWPLAETWRKCARTFSSTLNLMDQYPEFLFVQPAPCHAEVVREEYPGIFARMQKAAAAGRWEPNGAMWVEPDCNVPSGESFVRQLLVGQQATREMFGYTADTLWLPDVFGYSAALPQILQGCNVEFFCTTKISWNDTTRFPYDTFVWKGIDGTAVIAHYNSMHCWPDPATLTDHWNWVQHKDVQDRRLCAFGFGDGGGGPMAEMCEIARRVEDLEGCPRTAYTTVGDFMKNLRDELTDLPEWSGELYLELHRGTLTSIAKIKRGNRKTELALRETELLCTLAALQGARYPADALRDLWKTLLTNQFHDILPGSSIAEVNDEAIESFDAAISEAQALAVPALKAISGKAAANSMTRLVVNSLSWPRTEEIEIDDAPNGTRPADPDLRAQWIEDVTGTRKLVVDGLTVPPLGSAALKLAKGQADSSSAFKVSGNRVETPHAKIRFDKIGRIVSLVDKASGREIVRPRGALNSLLIGEDIPQSWDNWDIDADHRLKMVVEDRLLSREVVTDGPLQLRLRSEYQIGSQSRMAQDLVLHATTPRVDFETVIDWAEKHRLLKAGFQFDVLADSARHEIQYGHVERPTHQNLDQDRARFEVCAHKWTDLSEHGFGVALLNDCKYGVGVSGSEIRLSLMKSGTHPDGRGDEGQHQFTYSLLPHACGFSAESVIRPAYELNIPPTVAPTPSDVTPSDSLLRVDAPNVIVESVKWAENGRGFVVRLYEAAKTGTRVSVKINVPVKSVSETNMLEEEPKKLTLKRDTASLYLRAFEIKTLYCEV